MMSSSLPMFSCYFTFFLAVVVIALHVSNALETDVPPESCESELAGSASGPTVTVLQLGGNDKVNATTVLVIDNLLEEEFLDQVVLQKLYESNLGKDWKPVDLEHHEDYQSQVDSNSGQPKLKRNLFVPKEPTKTRSYPTPPFAGLRYELFLSYENKLRQALQDLDLASYFGLKAFRRGQRKSPVVQSKTLYYQWNLDDSFFGNLCYHSRHLSKTQSLPQVHAGGIQLGNDALHFKPYKLAMVHFLSDWTGPDSYNDPEDVTLPSSSKGGSGIAFYQDVFAGNRSLFSTAICEEGKKTARRSKASRNSMPWFRLYGCHCRKNLEHPTCQRILTSLVAPTQAQQDAITSGLEGDDSSSKLVGYPPYSIQEEDFQVLEQVLYRKNRAIVYLPSTLFSNYIPEEDVGRLSCNPKEAAGRMEVYSNKQLTHETIRVLTAIADPFWCLRAH